MLLFLSSTAMAQNSVPVVSNVTAQQHTAPSELVDIHYDVFDADGEAMHISVQISNDAGATWTVPVNTIYGDIGSGIISGNHHIIWDAGIDFPDMVVSSMKVKIMADDGQSDIEMVLVPAGTFMMGQEGVAIPVHEVTLTHDFYLGTYEVTNQEYVEAVQWAYDNGYVTASTSTVQAYDQELLSLDNYYSEITFSGGVFGLRRAPNSDQWGFPEAETYNPAVHPVQEVSWYGSACFCDWLSLMNDLPVFYEGNWDHNAEHDPYLAAGYRLPTEAEWEYAARCNDGRTYPWGDTSPTSNHANYIYNVGWTTPVGSYPLGASELGLMDMAGNMFEWIGDKYGSYSSSSQTDPYGGTGGSARVIRGGCWFGYGATDYLRCAHRKFGYPHDGTGFRLCRTVNP